MAGYYHEDADPYGQPSRNGYDDDASDDETLQEGNVYSQSLSQQLLGHVALPSCPHWIVACGAVGSSLAPLLTSSTRQSVKDTAWYYATDASTLFLIEDISSAHKAAERTRQLQSILMKQPETAWPTSMTILGSHERSEYADPLYHTRPAEAIVLRKLTTFDDGLDIPSFEAPNLMTDASAAAISFARLRHVPVAVYSLCLDRVYGNLAVSPEALKAFANIPSLKAYGSHFQPDALKQACHAFEATQTRNTAHLYI